LRDLEHRTWRWPVTAVFVPVIPLVAEATETTRAGRHSEWEVWVTVRVASTKRSPGNPTDAVRPRRAQAVRPIDTICEWAVLVEIAAPGFSIEDRHLPVR
jgi:hypothetical protein